jgi:hypothetical protein
MPTEDAGLVVPPSKAAVEEDPRIAQIEAGVELADIPAALEYLQSKGAAGKYGDLMATLVRQLAESDLGQAVRWVEQMPAGEARLQAIKNVSILWAITNAVEAIEWIKELPEGEERNIALTSASYEIARTGGGTMLLLQLCRGGFSRILRPLPSGFHHFRRVNCRKQQWRILSKSGWVDFLIHPNRLWEIQRVVPAIILFCVVHAVSQRE